MADITFTQGEDVELSLTVQDVAELPIDITGDTFEASIKDIDDLGTLLGEFTYSIPTGSDGMVILSMLSTVSLLVPYSVQYDQRGLESDTPVRILMYDIFRTRIGDGKKRALVSGLVKVYPAISL